MDINWVHLGAINNITITVLRLLALVTDSVISSPLEAEEAEEAEDIIIIITKANLANLAKAQVGIQDMFPVVVYSAV